MVELKNISYTFSNGRRIHYPDWSLRQGMQALVCGNHGSGKTTLLYLLAGLLRPEHGSLRVCDYDITAVRDNEMDRIRGRHIGFVSSSPSFIREFTLQDNLLLAQRIGSGKENVEKLYMLLHEFGIAGRALAYPCNLSRLELRIAAILRAVINRPKLILSDDPLANLKENEKNIVFKVLTRQARNYESTLVLASHNVRIRDIFPNQLKLENA